MLEQVVFTGREVLLAVLLAAVVYLLEVWVFSRAARRRGARRVEQDFAERLRGLEQEVQALRARLDGPPAAETGHVQSVSPAPEDANETDTADAQSRVYAEVQRLVQAGLSVTEAAARLGISRGEAELVLALHQARHAPHATSRTSGGPEPAPLGEGSGETRLGHAHPSRPVVDGLRI